MLLLWSKIGTQPLITSASSWFVLFCWSMPCSTAAEISTPCTWSCWKWLCHKARTIFTPSLALCPIGDAPISEFSVVSSLDSKRFRFNFLCVNQRIFFRDARQSRMRTEVIWAWPLLMSCPSLQFSVFCSFMFEFVTLFSLALWYKDFWTAFPSTAFRGADEIKF